MYTEISKIVLKNSLVKNVDTDMVSYKNVSQQKYWTFYEVCLILIPVKVALCL